MAEFDVTLSMMEEVSQNIRKYAEEFNTAADEVLQAANILSESWTGDASQEFHEKVTELRNWMAQMKELLDVRADTLVEAGEKYEETDTSAAKAFRV